MESANICAKKCFFFEKICIIQFFVVFLHAFFAKVPRQSVAIHPTGSPKQLRNWFWGERRQSCALCRRATSAKQLLPNAMVHSSIG